MSTLTWKSLTNVFIEKVLYLLNLHNCELYYMKYCTIWSIVLNEVLHYMKDCNTCIWRRVILVIVLYEGLYYRNILVLVLYVNNNYLLIDVSHVSVSDVSVLTLGSLWSAMSYWAQIGPDSHKIGPLLFSFARHLYYTLYKETLSVCSGLFATTGHSFQDTVIVFFFFIWSQILGRRSFCHEKSRLGETGSGIIKRHQNLGSLVPAVVEWVNKWMRENERDRERERGVAVLACSRTGTPSSIKIKGPVYPHLLWIWSNLDPICHPISMLGIKIFCSSNLCYWWRFYLIMLFPFPNHQKSVCFIFIYFINSTCYILYRTSVCLYLF